MQKQPFAEHLHSKHHRHGYNDHDITDLLSFSRVQYFLLIVLHLCSYSYTGIHTGVWIKQRCIKSDHIVIFNISTHVKYTITRVLYNFLRHLSSSEEHNCYKVDSNYHPKLCNSIDMSSKRHGSRWIHWIGWFRLLWIGSLFQWSSRWDHV